MQVLGDLMVHYQLVSRMAQATGTDVVGLSDSHDLDQQSWADMVQTCRGCGWAQDCPGWLDAHGDIAHAPPTCRNRSRFEALRAAGVNADVA